MPTQEERLTTLEQTIATRLKEINENAAMTIGLVKRYSYEISRINSDTKNIREILEIRFDATNAHLELLQSHSEKTDKRLNNIDTRLDRMETLLVQILERLPEKP